MEPLVPIRADPTPSKNAALATALLSYSNCSRPDDFSSLTGFFRGSPKLLLERRAPDQSWSRILRNRALLERVMHLLAADAHLLRLT